MSMFLYIPVYENQHALFRKDTEKDGIGIARTTVAKRVDITRTWVCPLFLPPFVGLLGRLLRRAMHSMVTQPRKRRPGSAHRA